MGEPKPSLLTFRDAMAKVGEFLFYWSCLEQQLTLSIQTSCKALNDTYVGPKGGLADRLDLWLQLLSRLSASQDELQIANAVRDQALSLRDVRNLIVHGVQAGSSAPITGSAYIRCAIGGYEDPDSETVCYTLDEIEHFTQAADACRRAFLNVNYFNYRIALPATFTSDAQLRCHLSRGAS